MTHLRPLRAAALVAATLVIDPSAAGSQASPRPPARTAAPTPSTPIPAEEERYARRADELRRRIMAAGRWTDLEGDSCSVGALRTFSGDSASQGRVVDDVAELERIIIARGIDTPIDTPQGHELLRTVVAWEAQATRPRWDVAEGETPRQAIAAGLGGMFRNPDTKKCESFVPGDTATIVLPPLTRFTPPATPGVRLALHFGDEGVKRIRDEFHARIGVRNPQAVLTYTKVRVAVLWRDYAVVAVNRPAEQGGVLQLNRGLGGGTFIFRRVGNEWRLLSIVRTWA